MIFNLTEEQVLKLEKLVRASSLAEEKQMNFLTKMAPGLVEYGRFTDNSKSVEIDFISNKNKELNRYLASIFNSDISDPVTIHYITYNVGGEALEHKDENSLHTYVIMLEDNFKGGDFYLRGEKTNFKKRGQVAYYLGMDAPHKITKITEGQRKVLVVWYSNYSQKSKSIN